VGGHARLLKLALIRTLSKTEKHARPSSVWVDIEEISYRKFIIYRELIGFVSQCCQKKKKNNKSNNNLSALARKIFCGEFWYACS
jgi:hypothetical protein